MELLIVMISNSIFMISNSIYLFINFFFVFVFFNVFAIRQPKCVSWLILMA